jgi:uncharacterized damage-inducible protein DinB
MKSSLRSYFASPVAPILLVIYLRFSGSFSLPGPAAHRSRHEQKGNGRFLIASHRKFAEYEVRSAAEGMPENLYTYRPSEGKFKSEKPAFGSSEMRTFSEQAKHVACANFAFAAEFDGQQPPAVCDKGGPDPAKTKRELLIYLRNSFAAISKSFQAIKPENQFDPIEGPYASPNTRLGLAVVIWHNADHYGQMVVYLRLNGIVPPPSRPNPPPVKDTY